MKIVSFKQDNILYNDMTLIENLDDLIRYFDTKFKTRFQNAAADIIAEKSKKEKVEALVQLAERKTNSLYNLSQWGGKIQAAMLKQYFDGKQLCINPNGGWFYIYPNTVINSKNKIYTHNDIKIFHWNNGKHFYAKVDGIDVVDDDGNAKWNTYERAYEVSVKFLNDLNND